jgi:hypothetical protein
VFDRERFLSERRWKMNMNRIIISDTKLLVMYTAYL